MTSVLRPPLFGLPSALGLAFLLPASLSFAQPSHAGCVGLSCPQTRPAQPAHMQDLSNAGTAAADHSRGAGDGAKSYGATIRACIQPNMLYNSPPARAGVNPRAEYRVHLSPDGHIAKVTLTRFSGFPLFDAAVGRAILGCDPFPKPSTGSYPPSLDIAYDMY